MFIKMKYSVPTKNRWFNRGAAEENERLKGSGYGGYKRLAELLLH